MDQLTKLYFNWSTGKDSALALLNIQNSDKYNIGKLITTVNSHYQRISMHGIRIELLEQQGQKLGIPLEMIRLPESPTMEEYENIMAEQVAKYKTEGYNHCVFGDIFLEDLRNYREEKLGSLGISCIFPLWQKDTRLIVEEFIQKGFKAVIVCINSEKLPESFLGKEIDKHFLDELPEGVDPCGENGEFHTFCYDEPIFKEPVQFFRGEKTYKEYTASSKENNIGFWFLDLIPE